MPDHGWGAVRACAVESLQDWSLVRVYLEPLASVSTTQGKLLSEDLPENGRYAAATTYLSGLDADWAALVASVGPCTHLPRPEREPYEALMRAVAYQQLHTRAGDAILGRLLTLNDGIMPTPLQLLALDQETLRSCGFSVRKIGTLRGIAAGALDGTVPCRAAAERMADDELLRRLTSLRGIGRWTVEMLLIYTLERPDILPIDDFGVRDGYRRLKRLGQVPTPRQLQQLGETWQPYRTIAAWYLWRVPR
jgi:DNA-3-methyladenine glycosylase II